mmetsp:Transcript_9059/g.12461  ORF Transcript_9059/g.12461 Transcript_9059/m.12461 type:complete len:81 (+) Transcript_9059:97-339(+)|eukprot:CAMPEP_0185263698 /NCGR_PEP_ID=MMETSP1359-20130426/15810_1 /TAXON_ID=552665 /ORGANISM="Bigelowiella longifila, Strain CCMP242" /LENGTH=80 /DNA_ID=CAMNT_0027851397 /DNA_START=91 /DNA_END=333 /DNA_ORIENTATION=+
MSEEVPAFRKVSLKELEDNRIDFRFRDECAHILIPLNACRRRTGFSVLKCVDLRHAYEACQYERYKQRVKARMDTKAKAL